MDRINILISIDNNYVEHAIDLLYSIHMHNDAFLNVFLIYSDLSNESIFKIKNILSDNNIGKLTYYFFNTENIHLPIHIDYISIATYFRLFAPLIIKEKIDRLLYLDCDIICTGDILDFYNMDFNSNTIIAVENFENKTIQGFNQWRNEELGLPIDNVYINAGVLLFNIPKYKNSINLEKILSYIDENSNILLYQDQDVINKFFYSSKMIANKKYNYQINYIDKGFEIQNPCLVHYSQGIKPWHNEYTDTLSAKFYINFIKEKEKNFNNGEIDIIIPVYNSTQTLYRTLSSVLSQIKMPKCKIYIIDDGSEENYESILNCFNSILDIYYYKLDKNYGPGYAREIGIQLSRSKYIIFLDSDDVFATSLSVFILYKEIEYTKCDIVRSTIYEETNNCLYEYKNDNIGLHGKIYRRSYIEKNDIHFNSFKSNEDAGFNALLKLSGAKYSDINDLTYIWCNNENSLTRADRDNNIIIDIEFYAFNILLALTNAIERNCDDALIKNVIEEALIGIFNRCSGKVEEYINENAKNFILIICSLANSYSIFSNYNWKFTSLENRIKEFILFLKFFNVTINDEYNKKNSIQTKRKNKGLLFDYNENEFDFEKKKNMNLIKEYNETSYYEKEKRYNLIKKIFKSIGEGCTIEPPFHTNYSGVNVQIGNSVYINYNLSLVDDGNIYIGNNSLIGPNVTIITTSHPINPELRSRKMLYVKDVIIGENVWIGAGVTILPGITIGNNSVIGAGSIVTSNIPENVVAAGNPCKILRSINEDDNVFFYKSEKIDWKNI